MTDSEKLRLIIERAVENGWDRCGYAEVVVSTSKVPNIFFNGLCDEHGIEYSSPSYSAAEILSDKGLAKALWGTGGVWDGRAVVSGKLDAWEFHLQQLVLADDRIDYVYRSIDGK